MSELSLREKLIKSKCEHCFDRGMSRCEHRDCADIKYIDTILTLIREELLGKLPKQEVIEEYQTRKVFGSVFEAIADRDDYDRVIFPKRIKNQALAEVRTLIEQNLK